jgi:hypothetical protein
MYDCNFDSAKHAGVNAIEKLTQHDLACLALQPHIIHMTEGGMHRFPFQSVFRKGTRDLRDLLYCRNAGENAIKAKLLKLPDRFFYIQSALQTNVNTYFPHNVSPLKQAELHDVFIIQRKILFCKPSSNFFGYFLLDVLTSLLRNGKIWNVE